MSNWQGEDRRKSSNQAQRDAVGAHKDALNASSDSTDILLELQGLNQTLKDLIVPLLNKHDNCLYGKDGDRGIVRDINFVRGLAYLMIAICSGCIVAILHFIAKVF